MPVHGKTHGKGVSAIAKRSAGTKGKGKSSFGKGVSASATGAKKKKKTPGLAHGGRVTNPSPRGLPTSLPPTRPGALSGARRVPGLAHGGTVKPGKGKGRKVGTDNLTGKKIKKKDNLGPVVGLKHGGKVTKKKKGK